ncbi:DUF4124 domain-containing protein [Shewanella psychrotolerans]|uniref:DUF4124 domain-containing protein n=1 Tax=Shewanella psychrotolerans TaxID=2864206 RepID=UPI001C6585D1|nr:DUF4124 domain-containing protein [Shewanella psychrotolerans]QYK00867.1 DUF4124 domain-containing protein [Shewanella psychrotolerans]
MGKLLLTLTFMMLSMGAHANSIYKCIKGDKIVFSQSSCPKEFRQHEIQYQLGITTETDTDKKRQSVDPLHALLTKNTISKEKLLLLIGSEIYRLKQENSYYEILRASEKQKLDRKRYWQKQAKDDPEFIAKIDEMNAHFDNLIQINIDAIDVLKQHQAKIQAESIEDENASPTAEAKQQ